MEDNKKALPDYTKGEEIFNAVSHIVGGVFGVFVFVFSLIYGIANQFEFINIFAMCLYGASLILLYTMSSIYHFLRRNTAKRVFRIFDHCTIYLLIAGTYTPICLIALKGETIGLVLVIIQWACAVLGIIMNAINMHNKYVKIISMVLYLIMGWSAIVFIKPVINILGSTGFMYILIGGILYTVGVIFYAFGKKARYIHSIWHLFVLLGSIVHFLGILFYIYI